MQKKLLSELFIILLAVLCLAFIVSLIVPCIEALGGNIAVQRLGSGGEKVLLTGEKASNKTVFYSLQEQVFFEGEVSNAMKAGVTAMLLVRAAPMLFCGVCLFLFFLRVLRGELFSKRNVHLFVLCGAICLATTLLAPVLNGRVIPALVNATANQNMGVGVNMQSEPRLYRGLALLFFAFVLQAGEKSRWQPGRIGGEP